MEKSVQKEIEGDWEVVTSFLFPSFFFIACSSAPRSHSPSPLDRLLLFQIMLSIRQPFDKKGDVHREKERPQEKD